MPPESLITENYPFMYAHEHYSKNNLNKSVYCARILNFIMLSTECCQRMNAEIITGK